MRVTLACLLVIGMISVFDVYASIINAGYIYHHEQNPIAKIIIQQYGLYKFILVKSILTIVVLLICWSLSKTKYKASIFVVTVFQVLLFMYLNLSGLRKNPHDTEIYPIHHILKFGADIDEENEELFLK